MVQVKRGSDGADCEGPTGGERLAAGEGAKGRGANGEEPRATGDERPLTRERTTERGTPGGKETAGAQAAFCAGVTLASGGVIVAMLGARRLAGAYRLDGGPDEDALRGRVERAASLARALPQQLRAAGRPQLIAIAAYPPAAPRRVAYRLVETGTLLRAALLAAGWPLVEVDAPTLRRFAAGYPDATNGEVMRGLADCYALCFDSYDEAAAYGLAQVARCLAVNGRGYTAAQWCALERLWPASCVASSAASQLPRSVAGPAYR